LENNPVEKDRPLPTGKKELKKVIDAIQANDLADDEWKRKRLEQIKEWKQNIKDTNEALKQLTILAPQRKRLEQIKEEAERWNELVHLRTISLNNFQVILILVLFFTFVVHVSFLFRDVYYKEYATQISYFVMGEALNSLIVR
jgi:hypothetical protein